MIAMEVADGDDALRCRLRSGDAWQQHGGNHQQRPDQQPKHRHSPVTRRRKGALPELLSSNATCRSSVYRAKEQSPCAMLSWPSCRWRSSAPSLRRRKPRPPSTSSCPITNSAPGRSSSITGGATHYGSTTPPEAAMISPPGTSSPPPRSYPA